MRKAQKTPETKDPGTLKNPASAETKKSNANPKKQKKAPNDFQKKLLEERRAQQHRKKLKQKQAEAEAQPAPLKDTTAPNLFAPRSTSENSGLATRSKKRLAENQEGKEGKEGKGRELKKHSLCPEHEKIIGQTTYNTAEKARALRALWEESARRREGLVEAEEAESSNSAEAPQNG